jgi:hypothetical protein
MEPPSGDGDPCGVPALLVSCGLDWAAIPDPLPELVAALKDQRASITRFYSYPIGGFIESESLWRIDKPEILQAVASDLGMSPCTNAPVVFRDMPPYYWLRRLPEGD